MRLIVLSIIVFLVGCTKETEVLNTDIKHVIYHEEEIHEKTIKTKNVREKITTTNIHAIITEDENDINGDKVKELLDYLYKKTLNQDKFKFREIRNKVKNGILREVDHDYYYHRTRKGKNGGGFRHGITTNKIHIFVYSDTAHAKSIYSDIINANEISSLGYLLQNECFRNIPEQVVINIPQLKSKQKQGKRWNMPYKKRLEIWRELVVCENNAIKQTNAKFHITDSNFNNETQDRIYAFKAWEDYRAYIYKEYEATIKKKFGLDTVSIAKIKNEGLWNSLVLPYYHAYEKILGYEYNNRNYPVYDFPHASWQNYKDSRYKESESLIAKKFDLDISTLRRIKNEGFENGWILP